MISNSEIKNILFNEGRRAALDLQERSFSLTNTELNEEEGLLPSFISARKVTNMLQRPIGFVCRTSAGRVVKLLQPYDSEIFDQEPEDLPALWGFVWSTNPLKAKPFLALSTSPYNIGECCSENDIIYLSKIANNVWAPSAYPAGWEQV